MKIHYIIHAEFEGPGIIEEWAKAKKINQQHYKPFLGDKLPVVEEKDLVIIMGGPQSPLQREEAPYLQEEIDFIRGCIQKKAPILGFCLGAQLIGEALGAKTEKSPFKEVGIFPIDLTEKGKEDPLLNHLPQKFSVVHWHNDMPGLTKEAHILATSEGCPRQIIRYLPTVYGFQCHPEPRKIDIEGMIKYCASDLSPGVFIQNQTELLGSDFARMNEMMCKILDNFLKITNNWSETIVKYKNKLVGRKNVQFKFTHFHSNCGLYHRRKHSWWLGRHKLRFPEIKKTNGGPRVINHTTTKVIKNFSEKCEAKNCAQEWAEKKKRAFIKYNEPFYAINGAHGITKFVNGIPTFSEGFGNLEKSKKLGKQMAANENVRFIEPEEKCIPIVDTL